MIVKDIYKAVVLETPQIPTVKFFAYANEAVSELKNKYPKIEQEEITDLEQELTISERFKNAIVKRILASATTDSNLYGKYMSEYYESAANADTMFRRDNKGMGRVFAPKYFR